MSNDWLDQLNDAQRRAVTHGDGPLLVVAGAGTGKTRTLAYRVAYLVEQGVAPERILLLTFTRRAAAEMVRRATHLTGETTATKVWGGTFHAVANRLLRIYGRSLGLSPDFTVMDESDAADLMNFIRNELGLSKGNRRFARKQTIRSIYSRMVNAREKLADTLKTFFPWCQDDIEGLRSIFELYTTRKREQNVLDYDDLLLFWDALCKSEEAGQQLGDRFDHILVDEYQDTNKTQSEILRGMRKNCGNIMVVGDDAQSIYSFRAATVRNILDFQEQFPGATQVTLEQNYRSTTPILDASNTVMAQASERFTKQLWSRRTGEQKPVLLTCLDEPQQCETVCEKILTHLEQGIPLMRQAVLFRTGHHSDQLEVELTRRNIPFHKYGGLKFIESAHIKDMLGFLRILENPYDEISWFRILLLLDGIGPRTARRIMDHLGPRHPTQGSRRGKDDEQGALSSRLARLIFDPPPVPPALRKQFGELRRTLALCCGTDVDAQQAERSPAAPALSSQIELIRKFYEPVFERIYDNPTMRLRDIEQLELISTGYDSRGKFITDLTLDPPSSTADLAQPPFLEEDYLILSTIHSAKGCEWDVVHIIHAADGMIPSDMAVGDQDGIEEERRLLYVAMTRAKDYLYVYFPLRYYHRKHALGDAHTYAQLTRFIDGPVRKLFEECAVHTAHEDEPTTELGRPHNIDTALRELWQE